MSKPGYRQRFTDDEMEMVFLEGATDKEIGAKVRSPRYWTYIVRHPNGFVVAYGRGRSRQTCERNAGGALRQAPQRSIGPPRPGGLAAGASRYGRLSSLPEDVLMTYS
jgi:hypothetical protein